jgi:hypothetical protein
MHRAMVYTGAKYPITHETAAHVAERVRLGVKFARIPVAVPAETAEKVVEAVVRLRS